MAFNAALSAGAVQVFAKQFGQERGDKFEYEEGANGAKGDAYIHAQIGGGLGGLLAFGKCGALFDHGYTSRNDNAAASVAEIGGQFGVNITHALQCG
ncbi:hypothetical protein [Methylomonas koyamae]|uniref:Uncharacterized protein n=1 Tax=Methylomonas koyamae TaxID=702114 RepID=A0AA91I3U2_9GAMM|nr:hypothetical protein [Methylomonas koyamae]OAI22729.1 hypothetical protein A1356_18980 [Methylomonas koyamae]